MVNLKLSRKSTLNASAPQKPGIQITLQGQHGLSIEDVIGGGDVMRILRPETHTQNIRDPA